MAMCARKEAAGCPDLDLICRLGKDALETRLLMSDLGKTVRTKAATRRAPVDKRTRKPRLTGLHQSISRPTAILEALAAASSDGLRMTDVMHATGLGKATVHRLLAGLAAHRLVDQDSESARFFLGARILSWAVTAGDRFGLARLTEPAMARLAQTTLDTIYLTARSGDEAVCLNRREGLHPIKTLTLNVGDRRPLGVSAGGLALLAFLSDSEVERILLLQSRDEDTTPFRPDHAEENDRDHARGGLCLLRRPGPAWTRGRHRHGRRSGADPAVRQAADRLAQRRCNHGPASAAAPEGDRRPVAE